jgi:hypothetical protein
MFEIVTGRFNDKTRDTNYAYRQKHGIACIYCSPSELSPTIFYDTPVFVIEMNNQRNRIEGIGLIKNKPETNKYYKVHSDGNTNRYIYIGNYYITRQMIEYYNNQMLYALEENLFTGKSHSKRGQGLSKIPQKALHHEICKEMDMKKEIKEIFILYFREKIKQENVIKE